MCAAGQRKHLERRGRAAHRAEDVHLAEERHQNDLVGGAIEQATASVVSCVRMQDEEGKVSCFKEVVGYGWIDDYA